jgi:3-isopropylmalate/(R)-2-methylmalate dehydratase small subunit
MSKSGLGAHAFHDRRFTPQGMERPEFVLNQVPWREAAVLVAGCNFGCGSSREQAVWTLLDFGIRCVIARSFGEIFFNNCVPNGVLAIPLPDSPLQVVTRAALARTRLRVELTTQLIHLDGAKPIPFEIEARRREALLNGWDASDLILKRDEAAIREFEQRHRCSQPWLF